MIQNTVHNRFQTHSKHTIGQKYRSKNQLGSVTIGQEYTSKNKLGSVTIAGCMFEVVFYCTQKYVGVYLVSREHYEIMTETCNLYENVV